MAGVVLSSAGSPRGEWPNLNLAKTAVLFGMKLN